MAEVKEKGVETTKIEGVNTNPYILGVPVITTRLGDRENKPSRIRGTIAAQSRQGSRCHLLSSSQSFSVFRGSNGPGLRGVIWRVKTTPDIASNIGMSDIEPMTIIGSEGY